VRENLVPIWGKWGKGKEDGHQDNGCIPTAYMFLFQYTKRCSLVFLVAAMHSAAEKSSSRQSGFR
jgi:hypothetical protein